MSNSKSPSMVGQLGVFIALIAMVAIAGPAFFAGLIAAKLILSVPWILAHPLGAIMPFIFIVLAIVFIVGPIVGVVWILKKRPQR
jgi:hypothetical protein